MDHPRDIEWIELAGGTTGEADRLRLQSHLAGCETCRARAEAAADVWARLGDWQIDMPSTDMAARIAARAEAPSLRLVARWPALVKAAAAVVAAAGAGMAAAVLTGPGRPTVEPAQVASALYLDVVASSSATGLDGLLDSPDAADAEVQP